MHPSKIQSIMNGFSSTFKSSSTRAGCFLVREHRRMQKQTQKKSKRQKAQQQATHKTTKNNKNFQFCVPQK
jgi:hypothetical protein